MALTKSRGVDILTPDGNSLASFIDVNDGKWKLKDVNGNVDEAQSYISGGGGGNGALQTANAFSGTLQNVTDGVGNASVLNIATDELEILSTDTKQCPFGVRSITTGGGLYLMDNTTTDNQSVGVGALGNNLCFRAGGVAQGLARLFSTGNLVIGSSLTDNGFQIETEDRDASFNGVIVGKSNGTNSVRVGQNTLSSSTGNANVAVGAGAMSNNTTGQSNVALGAFALQFGVNGQSNVAIGDSALANNINAGNSGNSNVAVGRSALAANYVSNNTAVGHEAGLTNTTGTGLTAIGYQALRASTANNNTALGNQAGLVVSTGQANTIIGSLAGSSLTIGSSNTFIGSSANTVTVGGSSNTIIGASSTIGGSLNGNAVGIGASVSARDLGVTIGANAIGGASGVVIGQGATDNFGQSVVLGRTATSTASNQFVVGSATYNAGTVIDSVLPASGSAIKLWRVKINDIDYSILMIP